MDCYRACYCWVLSAWQFFFWAVRNGQYDDMEGAAHRVLMDDDEPADTTAETDESDDNNTPDKPQ